VLLPEMGTAYQEIAVLDLRDGRTALRASDLMYLYGGHDLGCISLLAGTVGLCPDDSGCISLLTGAVGILPRTPVDTPGLKVDGCGGPVKEAPPCSLRTEVRIPERASAVVIGFSPSSAPCNENGSAENPM